MNQQQKTLLSIVILIVAIAGGVAYYNHESNEIDIANAATPISKINTAPVASSTKPNISKNISVSTTYNVPDHNVNIITVNVTIKNGLIADVTHTERASDPTSQMIYDNFSKNLNKSKIVGKKISEVSLSKVGGASLTTKAFMLSLNKLAQI